MKPFMKMGSTVVVQANSTAPQGVRANANGNALATRYRIFNPDANTAWVAYGETGPAAQANAVIPLSGTPSGAQAVPTLEIVIIQGPPNCFWSAVCAAGNNNINVTPGDA